jgi:hypothetical protein
MNYEWDESKRQASIDKHGVDFRLAAAIFFSPTNQAHDTREDPGELRRLALGHAGKDHFVVVYILREQTRRLISAWKAGQHDRKRYDD